MIHGYVLECQALQLLGSTTVTSQNTQTNQHTVDFSEVGESALGNHRSLPRSLFFALPKFTIQKGSEVLLRMLPCSADLPLRSNMFNVSKFRICNQVCQREDIIVQAEVVLQNNLHGHGGFTVDGSVPAGDNAGALFHLLLS